VPSLRPQPLELGASLAGGVAIGAAYAAGRRSGLTRSDIGHAIAPGRPALGRAAQLALGTLAAAPGARARTPLRAAALGAAVGALAGRESRAFAAAAHALAALVAQRVVVAGRKR
jgi:hypothetical protein